MTDRRIDRTVSSHLAALEARVREIETFLGGGSSEEITRSFEPLQGTRLEATYGQLTSANSGSGPEVTVEVGRVGIIQVAISAILEDSNGPNGAFASFELSGANVRAAQDEEALYEIFAANPEVPGALHASRLSRVVYVEGLDPGLTTVTMVYRSGFATGTVFFDDRELLVIPH